VLYKVGLYSSLIALCFGSTLTIGIEPSLIAEEGLVFHVLVVVANVGLLAFFSIGMGLWFTHFNKVYTGSSGFVLWLYIGRKGFSGYGAHYNVKNDYI
jgi:hypothetical protein